MFLRRYPIITVLTVAVLLIGAGVFLSIYSKYARLVSDRLAGGSLRTSSTIYASPKLVVPGETMTVQNIVSRLQRAGYTEAADNPIGHYRVLPTGVEITTGSESYFQPHTAVIEVDGSTVKRVSSRTENRDVKQYWLEPEMVTSVLDSSRGKRRPVTFSEFPPDLVHAVVSVEDKRFFNHGGLDLIRIAKAAYVDIKEGRKEQGASTLTMQLARTFWLDQDKKWKRKLSEMMIAAELERRFSKEEIFQLYANEVYLGRRGSFSVQGFGEAAQAYFGKDLRKLTLPEAAMLAGMIQRPSYFNPFRYPDRVKQRRDLVLTLMHNNGYINEAQLSAAVATPIKVNPGELESSDAPYFVDLVNDELQDKFGDWDFAHNTYRIYSTIDLDLQRAAVEAVQAGMAEVDQAIKRKAGKKFDGKLPQVALVAMDPHTGAIKALVGGRRYQDSQLNRVLAMRQPGSSFKPFVYAAALNNTLQNKNNSITAATTLEDEPTTFRFNNQDYQPTNFHEHYMGTVTVRQAVMNSLNIPTIKVAEKVGYGKVVALARACGIDAPLQATPSLALGSYEVPPIEIAEAYTAFANGGDHMKRFWMQSIRDRNNQQVYAQQLHQNRAVDPRVNWIMVNIMEDVVKAGTAGSSRRMGITFPAAGKTGTARDGWFAGFTSKLLTVVWVGYDDYSDLDMEGAKSALPVWAEFNKRAYTLPQYHDVKEFEMPKGVVRASIDPMTGLLAGPSCPEVRTEYFVAGTQPRQCDSTHEFEYLDPNDPNAKTTQNDQKEKRGLVGRVLGVFR